MGLRIHWQYAAERRSTERHGYRACERAMVGGTKRQSALLRRCVGGEAPITADLTLPCATVTAWHALFARGKLTAGKTVLTLSTGGVSLFAAQFARMV
jgi:NADPH-dependent curcumin reductase CurA